MHQKNSVVNRVGRWWLHLQVGCGRLVSRVVSRVDGPPRTGNLNPTDRKHTVGHLHSGWVRYSQRLGSLLTEYPCEDENRSVGFVRISSSLLRYLHSRIPLTRRRPYVPPSLSGTMSTLERVPYSGGYGRSPSVVMGYVPIRLLRTPNSNSDLVCPEGDWEPRM